jgi:GAF domain-containing protein
LQRPNRGRSVCEAAEATALMYKRGGAETLRLGSLHFLLNTATTMEHSKSALRSLKSHDITFPAFLQTVCREITENVGSTRASVWTFRQPLRDAIECASLFDTRDGSFSSGAVLSEDDFPAYFQAITEDLRIVAPDAVTHPATSAFDDVYFVPLDIRSLLDFVVMVNNQPVAVLCCEHCVTQKAWSQADIDYLQAMAGVVTFGLKYAERVEA